MTEKKNMVIKVKYPTPSNGTAKSVPPSSTITEWNIKRIAITLGSLLLLMLSFFYFTDDSDNQNQLKTAQLASPEQQLLPIDSPPDKDMVASEKPAITETRPKQINSKAVVRAQLSTDIKKNEPVNKVALPLKIGKHETIFLHYFVELTGMKGKAIYHEWWLNGELVSRKKVNISDDPWRTSSKQIITFTTNNDWIVRLVDESRNKLNEQSFNLELK